MWHEDKKGELVNNVRMQQIIDSGAEQVATACSFCMIMLDGAAKGMCKANDMAVQDIAEIIAERL